MEVNYKKRLQNCYVGTDCISKGESREASKGGVDQVAGSTVWKRPPVPRMGAGS